MSSQFSPLSLADVRVEMLSDYFPGRKVIFGRKRWLIKAAGATTPHPSGIALFLALVTIHPGCMSLVMNFGTLICSLFMSTRGKLRTRSCPLGAPSGLVLMF